MNKPDVKEIRKKNRRSMITLIVVFVMPMLVAWIILKNIDSLKPSGSRNHGELVSPARPLLDFELQQGNGSRFDLKELKGKWSIIFFGSSVCDPACQEIVSKIHQARLAQGAEMHRVRDYYINTTVAPISTETRNFLQPLTDISIVSGKDMAIEKFKAQFSVKTKAPGEEAVVFLVDPLGNFMMSYRKNFTVLGLLKDLEHLLKYSQIG